MTHDTLIQHENVDQGKKTTKKTNKQTLSLSTLIFSLQ